MSVIENFVVRLRRMPDNYTFSTVVRKRTDGSQVLPEEMLFA